MLQFPKLVHATLPSVEDWGTNTNILRDPPKSIFTRKIDKVGQTSDLTQEIDDSGDRACEYIRVYARGSNPMVSVMYNNNGGAGGSVGSVSNSSRSQAFLPYRVAVDGAFRPPVLSARDLAPLSRQPRDYTTAFVQPTFADFTKKMMAPDKMREVKEAIHNVTVRPNGVFTVKRPFTETYDIKHNTVDRIKVSGGSGVAARDVTMKTNQSATDMIAQKIKAFGETVKGTGRDITMRSNRENFADNEVHQQTLKATGHTNISFGNYTSLLDDVDMNTSKYIQDGHYAEVNTALKKGEHTLILDEMDLARKMPEYSMEANRSDNRIFRQISHENDLVLERNLPSAAMTVNAAANRGIDQISSREAYLAPKPKAGGFDGRGFQPTFGGEQAPVSLRDERHTLNKQAYNYFQERYGVQK
jgi:hypothetical protein